jgi:hypothetical protein
LIEDKTIRPRVVNQHVLQAALLGNRLLACLLNQPLASCRLILAESAS